MTDIRLVVAELCANELLSCLQAAVDDSPHWRFKAAMLLGDIAALRLPAHAFERLKEIDARKRAAEQMEDTVDA